jgi:hypothetical protein
MEEKKKTYTKKPEPPEELRTRYEAILSVLGGTLTVAEAARRLDLSRPHFQSKAKRSAPGSGRSRSACSTAGSTRCS